MLWLVNKSEENCGYLLKNSSLTDIINPRNTKGNIKMDFLNFAKERYSVRKFTDNPLTDKEISTILEAGHIAPTGCNYQPQRILVINTAKSIEKLKKCTKCHFDAPCALLVCYNKDESWVSPFDGTLSAPVDASIVTTHMMLQAHSMGIGSCWVMYFDPQKMREEFDIPDNIIPAALLVMGHPADNCPVHPFHSTFRPKDEVICYGSFAEGNK